MIDPILIGYFPKRTEVPPDWDVRAKIVTEICSVSGCLAEAPEDWIQRWRHNDLGFYNTRADALSIVPPGATDFHLFAYRLLPIRYSKEGEVPFLVETPEIESLPQDFISMGFDVATKHFGPFFECSPLSCNALANETSVNQFCLLPTVEKAIDFARFCVRDGKVEPGPYYVVEVLAPR